MGLIRLTNMLNKYAVQQAKVQKNCYTTNFFAHFAIEKGKIGKNPG